MNPLPVQPAKIHCPPRRDDTLSRERLNSWLDTAAAGRLGLIVAEAGFGKTTLLADWAGHTRRDTAWYRLEPDDRDWLTFIRHLVAGGRELDPEFAPDTFRMLLSLGPGGPTPKDLAVSIAREMAEFGVASARGLTLILDDYHVVDGCAETEPIVRALLDRTAPGFSVVIATRSKPTMPMGRIRARGGVMTIAGSDLCFDIEETSRLFRDAYHQPLDEESSPISTTEPMAGPRCSPSSGPAWRSRTIRGRSWSISTRRAATSTTSSPKRCSPPSRRSSSTS